MSRAKRRSIECRRVSIIRTRSGGSLQRWFVAFRYGNSGTGLGLCLFFLIGAFWALLHELFSSIKITLSMFYWLHFLYLSTLILISIKNVFMKCSSICSAAIRQSGSEQGDCVFCKSHGVIVSAVGPNGLIHPCPYRTCSCAKVRINFPFLRMRRREENSENDSRRQISRKFFCEKLGLLHFDTKDFKTYLLPFLLKLVKKNLEN